MKLEESSRSRLEIRQIAHGSPEYWATVELRDAVLRQPLGLRFTPEQLQAESGSHHFACYRDDRLAACLVLRPRDDGDIQMRQVAVAPDLQRQGIGKNLVEYAETWARSAGYRRMVLHAREMAVPFYEALGYRKHGEPFPEVTLPHWAIDKRL
jgi:GNAT superfamily N-acetyltransferase